MRQSLSWLEVHYKTLAPHKTSSSSQEVYADGANVDHPDNTANTQRSVFPPSRMASKTTNMGLPNSWHLRRVAEKNAKACWICYKGSSSVLITPDRKDFFYICPGHLKDRTFCTPDEAEAAAIEDRKKQKQKELLEKEKQKVIQEYEQRKKEREKKRSEKKNKDKKTEEEDRKKDKKDEEEKKGLLEDIEKKHSKKEDETEPQKEGEEEEEEEHPRIFNLKPAFFQQRIRRLRDIEQVKKNADTISNGLPSVPTSKPGGP